MPKTVLRLGYPTKAKALLCLPVAACLFAGWRTLSHLASGLSLWDLPILAGLILAAMPAVYCWRTSFEISADGVTSHTVWGKRHFRREEFLGYELIAQEPGELPDLLLRFKSGIVFLSAGHVDRTSVQIVDFLRAEWGVTVSDYQPPVLGAVDPVQSFEYETLHVAVLTAIAVVCLVVVLRLPVFGMLALVTAFCFRAAWRAMSKVDTDENGITLTHPLTGEVKLAWKEIESAGFWTSFAQGGVRIRDKAGRTIRVYRWIGGYPLLNRLMHDRLADSVFWPKLQLPMRVDLNRRRRLGALCPYLLLMGNAVVLLLEGNFPTFAIVAAVPTFVAASIIWGSSRELLIDQDGIRDVWRYLWFRKSHLFNKTDLLEARLGRQLSVGGLWMKFGETRLEIANSDASLPPERILACLRQNWAWERRGNDAAAENDRLRGAA